MSGRENTVFIGGIPYSIGEEKVVELLRNVGNVVSFRMLKDNDTGRHRGHAFCDYENVAQANVAIEKLNGYEIEGRKLRVKFANEGKSGSGRGSNGSGVRGQDVDWALNQLTNAELYDILGEMKTYIKANPVEAKSLLQEKPSLTHALLKAQIRLDLIQQPPPSHNIQQHMPHNMPPQHNMPPGPPPSHNLQQQQQRQPPPHNNNVGMPPMNFANGPPGSQGQGMAQPPPPNRRHPNAPPTNNMMIHGQQQRGPPPAPPNRAPLPPGQPPHHAPQWQPRGPLPPHGPPMSHGQRSLPPPGFGGGPPPPHRDGPPPQQRPPQQQQPPPAAGGANTNPQISSEMVERVLGYTESQVADLEPGIRMVVQQIRAQYAQQNQR